MKDIKILKYYSILKKIQEEVYEPEKKKKNIFKRIFNKFKNRKKSKSKSVSVELSDDDCIICFDTLKNGYMTLSCGHKYHECCIKEWINEKVNCPICRRGLINKDYYKLTSKNQRIKQRIKKFIYSFLEFVIVTPLCLLADSIMICGQLIKLTFEGIVVIFDVFCCCFSQREDLREFHSDCWDNPHRLFGYTRSFLTMSICNQIRHYLEIRMSLMDTFRFYEYIKNPPLPPVPVPEIQHDEVDEIFSEFNPALTLTDDTILDELYDENDENSDVIFTYLG